MILHTLITVLTQIKQPFTWQEFLSLMQQHIPTAHQFLLFDILLLSVISLGLTVYFSRYFAELIALAKTISQENLIDLKIDTKNEFELLKLTLQQVLLKMRKNQKSLGEELRNKSRILLDSEKKHRELLNILADLIFELDAKRHILATKHIQQFLGYAENEILGRKIEDFILTEDRPLLINALHEAEKQHNHIIKDLKLRLITIKKEIKYTKLSFRLLFENQKLSKIEGILRDITQTELMSQNMLAEKEKLEQTYQNLHQSYLALGRVNAQVAALAEINTTFASNLNWQDKLHYIIESIKTFLQADETLLFIRSLNEKNYLLKNVSNDAEFWQGIKINKRQKMLREIFKLQKPLKCFNPQACFEKEKCALKKYQGLLAIPIIINSEIVGLFVLLFKNPDLLANVPTKLTLAYTSQMAITLMMSGELDHSLKRIF